MLRDSWGEWLCWNISVGRGVCCPIIPDGGHQRVLSENPLDWKHTFRSRLAELLVCDQRMLLFNSGVTVSLMQIDIDVEELSRRKKELARLIEVRDLAPWTRLRLMLCLQY